ncbi:MAG: anti-sigma factor RsiW [Gammaproteobacteria bacterium]
MLMNCLQFRRAVEADPNGMSDLERAHTQQCPACAEHARRIASFNRVLSAAVNTSVPDNLSEKIILRHAFRSTSAQRFHWPALAAGLLLVSAALAVGGYFHKEAQLKHEVIAMVDAADYALQARGPVAVQSLSKVLETLGLRLNRPISNVSFAGRCLVRGHLSGHVVLRDIDTPITVFLMPEEHLLRQTKFESAHWSGLLAPADNGAIAIVAPRGQELDAITLQVLAAIQWPT